MTDSNEGLLASDEPALKHKINSQILGSPADSPEMLGQREEILGSARVIAPLSKRGSLKLLFRQPRLPLRWGGYARSAF